MLGKPALGLEKLQQDRKAQAACRRPVGQKLHFLWLKQPVVQMKSDLHGVGALAFPRATAR